MLHLALSSAASGKNFLPTALPRSPLREGREKETHSRAEMTTSLIDNIIGNEDIAFHISSFLCPQRNPATLTEFYANECFVAKLWNNAFGLVRAQLRWDFLRTQLKNDEVNGWLYHKLMYIPKGVSVPRGGGGKDKLIPHEGIIRIFRSHVNGKMAFRYIPPLYHSTLTTVFVIKDTCFQSFKDYRSNRQNDQTHREHNRADSRPDYYYRTYREISQCIELVPPKALTWTYDSAIIIDNDIEYDDKPRLINEFTACLDDVNGASGSLVEEKSKEGRWNLGYHEVVSLRDATFSRVHPRPPRKGHGTDTTNFLKVLKAKPSMLGPRRVKLAHLACGDDKCRIWLKKHLLPIIGPRPSGKDWTREERN